jgi:equilibrative nucleoside transporter 1/2/3
MHGGERRSDTAPQPLLASTGQADPPRDPYKAVLFALGLQGIGALFAWNSIISPISYYKLSFADSPFRNSFESLLSVTFTGVGLVALIALQLVQHLYSLRAGILVSLTLMLSTFLALSIYTLWPLLQPADDLHADVNQDASTAFVVTLICTAVASTAQAGLTSSLFAYSSAFPRQYTQAVSSGMAVAGLAVSIANLASAGDEVGDTPDADFRDTIVSAVASFGVAAAVFAACLVFFVLTERTEFVRVTKRYVAKCDGAGAEAAARPGEADAAELVEQGRGSCVCAKVCGGGKGSGGATGELVRRISPFAFALVFNFTVTIGLFPAITGMISSVSDVPTWKTLFASVVFVAFNLGDLLGRTFPPSCLARGRNAVAFALCRALLAPLFMLCHMPPGKSALPALLDTDAAPLLLVFTLGVTNGMLTSSALMHAPHAVRPAESRRAASLMILALNIGLVFGSLISFLFHWVLCDCDPFLA